MFRHWPVAALVFALVTTAAAGPFVLFPKAEQLASPTGQYVVRSTNPQQSASEFVGTFQTLWLTDLSSGRTYKLCDYLGVAAVAWSGDEYVIITDYVAKKTSRVLVFPAARPENGILLDAPTLVHLLPVELRPSLRENDHIFIEGSSVENQKLHLRVWGYGPHDRNGFRWNCQYGLQDQRMSCDPEHGKLAVTRPNPS